MVQSKNNLRLTVALLDGLLAALLDGPNPPEHRKGVHVGHLDGQYFADLTHMAIPHDDPIARGPAGHLTQIPRLALAHRPLARSLDEDRYLLAQKRQIILERDLILDGKQIQIPPMLDLLRDVVGKQLGSLGPWPYAVLVYETVLEATTLDISTVS